MQYTIKQAFKYIKFRDIVAILKAMAIFPFAIIAKMFIRNFWLVCEDMNEARDNGYWFFKWVRENKPGQKIAYAINKSSRDYEKVRHLGKIVQYGSVAHWFWYIVADKNISSQKGGKPNAAVCYLFEVVFKMRGNNRVFLQHGITINDGKWLYYSNTRMRLFITAAKPEDEFIKGKFGYPQGNVKLLGFCRFDNLHNCEVDKDLILVMPSWRNWLGRESSENAHMDFAKTEYCIKWNEFLHSDKLTQLLETYDKKLIFFPHRNMQKFISHFSTASGRIEVADGKKYDVQELLKTAALLVTDFSSVFFDFAYMRKPVIFYQFDEKQFREKQYAQGYFDYHNTVLGEWSNNIDNALDLMEKQIQAGFPFVAENIIQEFFPLYEASNCERTYNSITYLSHCSKL